MAEQLAVFATEYVAADRMAFQTVAAADISGRLFQSGKSAYSLSLAAKNLSVMAARIGEDAAGLKVLSIFYDQLAQRAIRSTRDISQLAQLISRNTMLRWRCSLMLKKIQPVVHRHQESQLLSRTFVQVTERESVIRSDGYASCSMMHRHLDDLFECMTTIQVVAVNARIEASTLKHHAAQMMQLSDSIENHSRKILGDVQYCQGRIREIFSE